MQSTITLIKKDIQDEGLFDRLMGGLLVSLMVITALSILGMFISGIVAFIGFCFGNPLTGFGIIGIVIITVLILAIVGMAINAKFNIV
jgi:hypothetical protein